MARRLYQDQANKKTRSLIKYLARYRDKAFNDLVADQRTAWDNLTTSAQAFVLLVKETPKEPNAE